MPDIQKPDLHSQIINIPIDQIHIDWVKTELTGETNLDAIIKFAYKCGHGKARHAAAELVDKEKY